MSSRNHTFPCPIFLSHNIKKSYLNDLARMPESQIIARSYAPNMVLPKCAKPISQPFEELPGWNSKIKLFITTCIISVLCIFVAPYWGVTWSVGESPWWVTFFSMRRFGWLTATLLLAPAWAGGALRAPRALQAQLRGPS